MAAKIKIPYGYYHPNVAMVRVTALGPIHLAAYTEDGSGVEIEAVCGVRRRGTVEFDSGYLCPKCASVMDVRSLMDFARDDDEASWMEAQV